MNKLRLFILGFILSISINLNLFQRRNQAITCENIDKERKAEVLFFLGHKHLDRNWNWKPCENLFHNP